MLFTESYRLIYLRTLALSLLLAASACTSIPRRSSGWAHTGPFAYSVPTDRVAVAPVPSAHQDFAALEGTTHRMQLLETGDDALLARVHLIRAAEKQIDVQSYIWRQDGVTRFLWDELMDAADRGVRVRILIDAFPPMGSAALLAQKAFAHEGIELRLFNPPFPEASVRNLRQPAG
jgi:cardiolipin synthase C